MSLESDARRLAVSFDKYKLLILLVLTIVYGAGAALHARSKPLWYDEIVTVIAASAPDGATAWKTAQQTDANPPLPHLLTHFFVRWFGSGEIAVRAPAIMGFWVFCLCLFRFTLRRTGIYYAFAALLLPVVTEAYRYAFEARAYGPELAFCGLALVAWQAATEKPRRILAPLVLAASLAAAILCHYYAVLIYLPLAGAEAFRSRRARRIEWRIWAAFAAGGAPVVWRITSIAGAFKLFAHPWSPPYPAQVVEFWDSGLQPLAACLVMLTALVALSIVVGGKKPDDGTATLAGLRDHELVAGVLFLLIPVAAVAGALLVTHMFTERYALLALTGLGFLVPMAVAHFAGGRSLVGFLLMVTLAAGLGFVTIDVPPGQDPFRAEPVLEKALRQEPVVISDGLLFLRMWHYAPGPLKTRLLFLADNDAAVKYMGFDSIDIGLRLLRPWARVSVMEYRSFASPGREFLVYENTLRPTWVVSKVLDDGGSADLEAYTPGRALLRLRLKR